MATFRTLYPMLISHCSSPFVQDKIRTYINEHHPIITHSSRKYPDFIKEQQKKWFEVLDNLSIK